MYKPDKGNYQGIKGLVFNLSTGISGKTSSYHLSCLCKEHASMLDKYFVKKIKKAVIPKLSKISDGAVTKTPLVLNSPPSGD